MAFDPDAYLAGDNQSSFDPEEYLKPLRDQSILSALKEGDYKKAGGIALDRIEQGAKEAPGEIAQGFGLTGPGHEYLTETAFPLPRAFPGQQQGAVNQVVAGVANLPADIWNFATSPAGVAAAGVAGVGGPLVQRALALGFTSDQIRQGMQANTLQDQVELALGATLGAYGVMRGEPVEAQKPRAVPLEFNPDEYLKSSIQPEGGEIQHAQETIGPTESAGPPGAETTGATRPESQAGAPGSARPPWGFAQGGYGSPEEMAQGAARPDRQGGTGAPIPEPATGDAASGGQTGGVTAPTALPPGVDPAAIAAANAEAAPAVEAAVSAATEPPAAETAATTAAGSSAPTTQEVIQMMRRNLAKPASEGGYGTPFTPEQMGITQESAPRYQAITDTSTGQHLILDRTNGNPVREASNRPSTFKTPEEAATTASKLNQGDAPKVDANRAIDAEQDPTHVTVETLPTGEGVVKTTGIAQRVHDIRFDEGKIGEIKPGEGVSAAEMVQRGRDLTTQGADPHLVAEQFKAEGKISGDGLAVVRAEMERLSRETNAAEEAWRARPNDPAVKLSYDAAWNRETAWAQDVVKPMQTEWHKAGMVQQGETDIDTGTFSGLRRAVREERGRDVTPKESAQLADMARLVQEATKREQDALAKLDQALKKRTRDRPVKTAEELRAHFAERIRKLTPC